MVGHLSLMHRVVSRPKKWQIKDADLLWTGSTNFAARRTRSFAFPGPNRRVPWDTATIP